MNLAELITTDANVSITVNKTDLQDFAVNLIEQAFKKQPKAEPEKIKLYSREDVQQIFGVSRTALWQWDKKNILKPIRVGNLLRYREQDINRVIEQGKKT